MLDIQTRWLIRRDFKEVLDIEQRSFDWPWTEEELVEFLRIRNAVGRVAEFNEKVVGYIFYKLEQRRYEVKSLAVDYDFRRQGVGRVLLARLECPHRPLVVAHVSEANLEAQQFMRACGYRAVSIEDRECPGLGDYSAIRFEKRTRLEGPVCSLESGRRKRNR
jgi:ribosomal-protein-alanine N-acetyltransferase